MDGKTSKKRRLWRKEVERNNAIGSRKTDNEDHVIEPEIRYTMIANEIYASDIADGPLLYLIIGNNEIELQTVSLYCLLT